MYVYIQQTCQSTAHHRITHQERNEMGKKHVKDVIRSDAVQINKNLNQHTGRYAEKN